MPIETKRPAGRPAVPFDGLTKRQRRIWAFIRANGPRTPAALHWKPFQQAIPTDELEVDMEAMIRQGWLRTVGRTPLHGVELPYERGYDIPEADREAYVRPIHRETRARLQKL